MELRQLEYFVAVAEEANFTRAAKRVHVAQPGVSAQVRLLEHELGQALFDRSGRQVRLTKAGAAVLPYARAALDAVAGARFAIDDLTGLMAGKVAVGMVISCSLPDLPELLAEFHQRHPGIEITLSEANSDVLLEALRNKRLDLALVGLASAPPQPIKTQVVRDEALVAAVSKEDVLALRTSVTLLALRDRPLISLSAGTGLRAALDRGLRHRGFPAANRLRGYQPECVSPTGRPRTWGRDFARISRPYPFDDHPCAADQPSPTARTTRTGLESRRTDQPSRSSIDRLRSRAVSCATLSVGFTVVPCCGLGALGASFCLRRLPNMQMRSGSHRIGMPVNQLPPIVFPTK